MMREIAKFRQTAAVLLLAAAALVPSGCFAAEPSHTLAHDEPGWHEVKCIRFSPDSTKVAAAHYGYMTPKGDRLVEAKSGSATVWDVGTGKSVVVLDLHRCTSLAFHPTKPWIMASGIRPALHVVDFSSNPPQPAHRWKATFGTECCRYANESEILANDKLVNSTDGSVIRRFDDPDGEVKYYYGADISGDGKYLIAHCGPDDRMRKWEIATGRLLGKSEPDTSNGSVNTTAISPDGNIVVNSAEGGSSIRLYDTNTWKELRLLKVGSWVRSIAFSPDGKTLAAACCAHPTIVMIDALLNPGGVVFFDVETGAVTGRLPVAQYSAIAWSPDGKSIATGTRFGEVRLWKLK